MEVRRLEFEDIAPSIISPFDHIAARPPEPTPEDPERVFYRMKDELSQIEFRINDTKRRIALSEARLKELNEKLKTRRAFVKEHAESVVTSLKLRARAVAREVASLEPIQTREQGHRDGMKRVLAEAEERYAQFDHKKLADLRKTVALIDASDRDGRKKQSSW